VCRCCHRHRRRRRRRRHPYLLSSHVSRLVHRSTTFYSTYITFFTIHYYVFTVQVLFNDYYAFISIFTVCTLVFTVHTLLIITFSLQYLLLLTEVLFTVLFTDRVAANLRI
jgi:hypothetical protein